ncbi:MAG TPA: adenosylcobinamide-GDP ribazoletransferase [Devosia sp.]|nr:adenosylcobinamide-GDP ribazoletransferase [Devosia sp.]
MSEKPDRKPHNDNHRPTASAGERTRIVDDLVMGVRFFSRLPTGDRPHERPDLSRIAMALPFASFLIGLLPALLLLVLSLAGMPRLFAAGLSVGAMAVITGAMSEDAIADAADGLFGGATAERRLDIMKDSRHGTFGVIALCLLLILRVVALGSLTTLDPFAGAAIWLGTTLMARSGALWLTVALPPARATGISASAGRVTRPAFGLGAIFALILGLILTAPGAGLAAFLLAAVLMAAIMAGWTELCRRLVGGQTGDLIGALQALLEIAGLGAFLLLG